MGMLQATEMPDGITKQSMWTALNPHGVWPDTTTPASAIEHLVAQ